MGGDFAHGHAFAEKVEEYLRRRGWSWRELCRVADMSSATPHRWKRGEGAPKHETIARIAQALAITPREEWPILASLYQAAGIRIPAAVSEREYAETIRQMQMNPGLADAVEMLRGMDEADRRAAVALLKLMQQDRRRREQ